MLESDRWPTRWIVLALVAALLVLRLPSLVQPIGADQALYAYVAQTILDGGIAYRDAWDQKPPAIHYTYALLRAVSSGDWTVAAADLVVAGAIALLLIGLGRRLTGRRAGGGVAAIVYLALANPALTRLGGIRVRSQCETFIALVVTAALYLALGDERHAGTEERRRRWSLFLGGVCLGLAVLFKYNAATYFAVALGALAIRWSRDEPSRIPRVRLDLAWLSAGALIAFAAMMGPFIATGTLRDLWEATVNYNLVYSNRTFTAGTGFVQYLLSFPVERARVDGLWLLGGLGCLVLLFAAIRERALLLPIAWIGAACLTIAVNGSRGLPQYFVQAQPALALAAGLAAAWAWPRLPRVVSVIGLVVVAFALSRVVGAAKLVDYTLHDLAYIAGRASPAGHLGRYGGPGEKHSPLAADRLADRLRAATRPGDTITVFGFSVDVYLRAERKSASRFCWSQPVVSEFNASLPGFGPAGLLRDLQRSRPAFVVLERNDQGMERIDSATYFLSKTALSSWLRANYAADGEFEDYLIWKRLSG